MSPNQQDPLHGKTLKIIVETLVVAYGWEELGKRIPIRCFLHDPSVPSSLVFLRKTPWAREKVEMLYLRSRRIHKEPEASSAPLDLEV